LYLSCFSYESIDALDGGVDGLDIVRQILLLAPQLLVKGGYVK
jgi:methylase of polypeptide subunit release factors